MIAMLLAATVAFAGCASRQPELNDSSEFNDPRDKIESYNRTVFAFNEAVDGAVFKPVANLYRSILPSQLRTGVSNFFSNLGDVPNALNNLLQGNLGASASDAARLLINSTLGIAGLVDVASGAGFVKHEEDFGQTLAVWGIGPGSYFVIPLLGPSTLRDFPSRLADYVVNPVTYISDSSTSFNLYMLESVQTRASFLPQEEIIRSWSPDFYTAVKNYYLSKRAALTAGVQENPAEELYQELD